jgi:hypothetical protein
MASMSLEDLVGQLSAAFGSGLRAVVLYGSAAGANHVPKKSDYNVLVLVDSLDAGPLIAAAAAIKAWSDAGNPPPLMLTLQEWRGSADIFPMEYADILERHKVLAGALPTDVRVDPSHLRLELEHEAMGTLLQLRRAALAAWNDNAAVVELLEGVSSTVMVIFRALLRLKGDVPPADNVALATQVASLARTEAEPFVRVLRHKRGEQRIKGAEAQAVLSGYLSGMQSVVRYLDQFTGRKTNA